jgi:hypothetical protein
MVPGQHDRDCGTPGYVRHDEDGALLFTARRCAQRELGVYTNRQLAARTDSACRTEQQQRSRDEAPSSPPRTGRVLR